MIEWCLMCAQSLIYICVAQHSLTLYACLLSPHNHAKGNYNNRKRHFEDLKVDLWIRNPLSVNMENIDDDDMVKENFKEFQRIF